MSPPLRKAVLTAHLLASLGWVGAVVCVLVVAVFALRSSDPAVARVAYPLMQSLGWWVLVPLSLASLVTGVVQSLGTTWGLLRHYWVIIKLLLTIVATAVLLLYMGTFARLAGVATSRARLSVEDLALLASPTVVLHSSAALLVLLTATILAVYKPRGRTRFGRRRPGR